MEEIKQEVLKYGRHRFTFGMVWDTLNPSLVPSRSVILNTAKGYARDVQSSYKYPLNAVAMRIEKGSSGHTQYGLCTKRSRVLWSMSAAATLVSLLPGSWAALVTIGEDTWWFIEVREDVIIQDIVYTEHDAAMSMFDMALDGDFHKIYVDPSIAGEDRRFSSLDIANVLSNAKGPRILPLVELPKFLDPQRRSRTALFMGVLIVGFGLYKGYGYYQQRQARLKQEMIASKLYRQQQQEILDNRVVVKAPWVPTQSVADMGRLCIAGWSHVPLSLPGYKLTTVDCTSGSVVSHFSIDPQGVPSWTRALLARYRAQGMVFDGDVSADGTHIDLTYKTDAVPSIHLDGLMDHDAVERAFTDFYYLLKASSSFMPAAPVHAVAPRSNGDKSGIPFQLPWYTMPYKIETSQMAPWLAFLSTVPGVSLDTISYAADQHKWTFSGIGYGR